jgi:hypothetical protein
MNLFVSHAHFFLEAPYADTKTKQRVVICALIYAKREHTYQIDTASFMLTTENWIPIESIYEVDLIEVLTEQKRRFVKPLRYDDNGSICLVVQARDQGRSEPFIDRFTPALGHGVAGLKRVVDDDDVALLEIAFGRGA